MSQLSEFCDTIDLAIASFHEQGGKADTVVLNEVDFQECGAAGRVFWERGLTYYRSTLQDVRLMQGMLATGHVDGHNAGKLASRIQL